MAVIQNEVQLSQIVSCVRVLSLYTMEKMKIYEHCLKHQQDAELLAQTTDILKEIANGSDFYAKLLNDLRPVLAMASDETRAHVLAAGEIMIELSDFIEKYFPEWLDSQGNLRH